MSVCDVRSLVLVASLLVGLVHGRALVTRNRRQTDSTGCVSRTLNNNEGMLTTNEFGTYSNNQDCCFELRPRFSGPGLLTLTIHRFNLESSAHCVYDYFEVDNMEQKVKQCGVKGQGEQQEVYFNHDVVTACFHSDGSVVRSGINVSYAMNPVFFVEEPSRQQNDTYLTTPPPAFSTDAYVDVSTTPIFTLPPSPPPTAGIPGNHRGCVDTTLRGNEGVLSTNQAGTYENNEDCCFELRPGFSGPGIINFDIEVFDIEVASRCVFDYFEISNLETNLKQCGTKNEGDEQEMLFSQGMVRACFHSDSSVVREGVRITYTMNPAVITDVRGGSTPPTDLFTSAPHVDPTPTATIATVMPSEPPTAFIPEEDTRCVDTTLHGNQGVLSTNEAGTYENNEDCCFELRPGFSGPGIINFEVEVFDIEAASRCVYDYFRVDNLESSVKECGTKRPGDSQEMFFNQGVVRACFHSDGSVVREGVRISYTMNPAVI